MFAVHIEGQRLGTPSQTRGVTAELRSEIDLPAESAGWDAALSGLLSAFDAVDVLALGEAHGRREDSDLRIRLIRHPDFIKKAQLIIVEFGDPRHQTTLDRYIAGEDVPSSELIGVGASGVYADLIAEVRAVNLSAASGTRVRVLLANRPGATPTERHDFTIGIFQKYVISERRKALLIFGAGHLWHGNGDLTNALQGIIPGRVLVVESLAPVPGSPRSSERAALARSLDAFEATLQSRSRPVLVSLTRAAAGKLIANPFYLGQAMLPSETKLGDLVDAVVFFAKDTDAHTLESSGASSLEGRTGRTVSSEPHEPGTVITVRGVVHGIDYGPPYVVLVIAVIDASGNYEPAWVVTGDSREALERAGWTFGPEGNIHPGYEITVRGYVSRSESARLVSRPGLPSDLRQLVREGMVVAGTDITLADGSTRYLGAAR